MEKKKLYEKVQLLKDGQIVEINGNSFKAKRIDDVDINPCLDICELDCICKGDVSEVCEELDWCSKSQWYLKLAGNHG